MAEDSIVEKMFSDFARAVEPAVRSRPGQAAVRASSAVNEYLQNIGAGAYNTAAGVIQLPAQAAVAGAQLIGGRRPSELQVPDFMAQPRKEMSRLAGVDTDKASPGFEPAFGFGRGAALGPSAFPAVAGGAASAIGETYLQDSPWAKLLVEAGLPLTLVGLKRLFASMRSGATRAIPKVPETSIPMDVGRATDKAKLIAEADWLAQHPKVADRVAALRKASSEKANAVLNRFLSKSVNADDAVSGKRAAEGWDAFVTSKQSAFQKAADARYSFIEGVEGTKPIVDTSLVRNQLKELYNTYAGAGGGPEAKKIADEVASLIQDLPKKATLQDVRQNMAWLNRASKPGKESIGIGSDVGALRAIKSSWDDSLKMAASQPTKEAESVKKLLRADEFYRTGSQDIQVLKDTALNTFFEVGSTGERIMLQPEKIMDRLRKMKGTERDFFVAVMEQQDPAMIDVLRKNKLENIISKGLVQGADATEPTYDIGKVLLEFDKNKDELKFLLPDKKAREGMETVIGEMRKAIQGTPLAHETSKPGINIAAGAVGATTNTMGAQPITRGILTKLGDIFTNKDELVDLMFGNKTNPATAAERWGKVVKEASTGGYQTNRAVIGGIDAAKAMNPSVPEATLQELPDPEGSVWDAKVQAGPDDAGMDRLLDIIAKIESSNNPKAVGPMTKSGERAKGMFQFMDATAKQYGVDDPFDPVQSRQGAKRYLKDLMKQFDGDLDKTVAAYNWGPTKVRKFGLEKAPDATKDYINKVTNALMEEE